MCNILLLQSIHYSQSCAMHVIIMWTHGDLVLAWSLGPPPPVLHEALAPAREQSRGGGSSCGLSVVHGSPNCKGGREGGREREGGEGRERGRMKGGRERGEKREERGRERGREDGGRVCGGGG